MKNYVIVLLAGISVLIMPGICRSQSYSYVFNTMDKGTHTTSCGEIEPQGWKVSRNSCNFYTPVTGVGSNQGQEDQKVDIKLRLRNSGNLDAKDFAWLFYYVNGKMVLTRTFKGDTTPASFEFSDTLSVPAGGDYKIRIALVCDENDEFWQLMNGDLIASVRQNGEPVKQVSFNPVSHDPGLQVSKEKSVARLTWIAEASPDANYFLIEKSRNGNDFEFAAYIKNENKTTARYSYIDHDLMKPETWYRVTQIGSSGKKAVVGNKVKLTDK